MRKNVSTLRVVIFGLGLMGGSLAMGLKGKCRAIYGVDPDPDTLAQARSLGIVDEANPSVGAWLPEIDLIILAAPVKTNLKLLDDIVQNHTNNAMIIDLGSTKAAMTSAMALLPPRFDPIGGHPICGKEHGGLPNADPGIFLDAPFALTPLARSSQVVQETAEELVKAVGAAPIWLDAETHDRWAASVSHLPFMIANALAAATAEETAPLIGPGFRSTARLAPTPWEMMGDILETNRENLLENMRDFRELFQHLENLLADGELEELRKCIENGSLNYRKLVT